MKTLRFKKNSIPYLLATKLGGMDKWETNTDICGLIRHILIGMFYATLLTAVFAMVSYALMHMLFGIGFSIYYGKLFFTDLGLAILISVGVCLFGLAFYYAITKYREYRYEKQYQESVRARELAKSGSKYVAPPDSFLVSAYKSIKGKFCAKVEFID